jgi:hypothetical protein
MDQDREDPGKQEPVTPEGAHGEQFYAILRAFYAILRATPMEKKKKKELHGEN